MYTAAVVDTIDGLKPVVVLSRQAHQELARQEVMDIDSMFETWAKAYSWATNRIREMELIEQENYNSIDFAEDFEIDWDAYYQSVGMTSLQAEEQLVADEIFRHEFS